MGDPEAFLVLNADIIGDYPLIDFVEFHRKHSGEHSILATEARRIIFLYFWLLNNAWWHAWFLSITQQGVHFSVIVRVEVDCQLVTCWLTQCFRELFFSVIHILLPMLKVISQHLLLLSWKTIFLVPTQTHKEELFFLLKLCLALMSQVYQFLKKKFHCFSRKVKQWFDCQCTVIGEINKLLLMTETCYNEHWTLSLPRSH